MTSKSKEKGKNSTIWVPESLKEKLKELKVHKNQAYHEVISQLIEERKK